MLRPTLFYSVVEILIFFNNLNLNDGVLLRMDWMDIDPSKTAFIEAAKAEIGNLKAFKTEITNNLELMKSATSTLEKNYILVLCKITNSESKKVALFYLAITESPDKKVILNTIGGMLDADESFDEKCIQVQLAAELYRRSKYAFQSIWRPSQDFYWKIESSVVTASIAKYSLKLHRFWAIDYGKEMVVLYANDQQSAGAYATIKIAPQQSPTVIKFEVIEKPLVAIFDALRKYMDAALDFEHNWNLVQPENGPSSDALGPKVRNCLPWLPQDATLTMFARTAEEDGMLSIIFQTSWSYTANTLIAVWHVTRKVLVHVSVLGTLEETLSKYRSIRTSEDWAKLYYYEGGVRWWRSGTASGVDLNVLRDEIILKFPDVRNRGYSFYTAGLLISKDDQLHKDMCTILANKERTKFMIVWIYVRTAKEVKIRDIKEVAGSITDAEKIVYDSVTRKYSDSLVWTAGCPHNFQLPVANSLLSYLNTTSREVLFYSINNTNLVIIMKFKDSTEMSKVCFVALKNHGPSYGVTWVGTATTLDRKGEENEDIQEAMQEAENYNSNSKFAYEEYWKTRIPGGKILEVEDGSEQELFSWNLPNSSNKIGLFGRFYNNQVVNFWYTYSAEGDKSHKDGSITSIAAEWYDELGEALQDLEAMILTKWTISKYVFNNQDNELIIQSAPRNAKNLKFRVVEESNADEMREGITLYICDTNSHDPNSKFLVVWHHSGKTQIQKLLYVSGFGDMNSVRNNAWRYLTSPMAFDETEFKKGIAWYNRPTPAVQKVRRSVHDYLKKEYVKMGLLRKARGKYFTQCHFGRVFTPVDANENCAVEYLLLGNISPPGEWPVYNFIVIKVQERKGGVQCLSFKTEKTEFVLEAQNNLENFLA